MNGVLQQVEAAVAAAPSGNQAGSLYRDSGVIASHSPPLLGAGASRKHHLPGETAARLGAFIGRSRRPCHAAAEGKQRRPPLLTVLRQSCGRQSRKREAAKAHRTGLRSRTRSPLPTRHLKCLKLN